MYAKLLALSTKVKSVFRHKGIKEIGRRMSIEVRIRLRMLFNRMLPPPMCKLCNGRTKHKRGYGRSFYQCQECEFIFAIDYDLNTLNRGMGMEGSWSGPGGGGYREYYLIKMLMQDLGFKSFLLYGTGNTRTFADLRQEGVNVIGCDISQGVVDYKKTAFGDDTFFTPDTLPADRAYDGIAAVEVFEHLADPNAAFSSLMIRLRSCCVICGTLNFYPCGPIADDNNPGYMKHKGHVAYWNLKSMRCIAQNYGYDVILFELIRPGSVLPDEKYGQLWPNKRVFFIYDPSAHQSYFENLLKTTPILPIDKP